MKILCDCGKVHEIKEISRNYITGITQSVISQNNMELYISLNNVIIKCLNCNKIVEINTNLGVK